MAAGTLARRLSNTRLLWIGAVQCLCLHEFAHAVPRSRVVSTSELGRFDRYQATMPHPRSNRASRTVASTETTTSPRSRFAQTATSWPLNPFQPVRPVRRAGTQHHSAVLEIAGGIGGAILRSAGATVSWSVRPRPTNHSATRGRVPRPTMLGNGVVRGLFKIDHDRCVDRSAM